MTADEMAAIHAKAMTTPAPWGVPTFEGFLAFPGAVYAAEAAGFALGRVIADEAELLTVAVLPEARRQGIAARCLTGFEVTATAKGARRVFLEVAASNAPARALYENIGYKPIGQRPGYYRMPTGARIDAILMEKTLSTA